MLIQKINDYLRELKNNQREAHSEANKYHNLYTKAKNKENALGSEIRSFETTLHEAWYWKTDIHTTYDAPGNIYTVTLKPFFNTINVPRVTIEERPDLKRYKYTVRSFTIGLNKSKYWYEYLGEYYFHNKKERREQWKNFRMTSERLKNIQRYLEVRETYNHLQILQETSKNFKTLEDAISYARERLQLFNSVTRKSKTYQKYHEIFGDDMDAMEDLSFLNTSIFK